MTRISTFTRPFIVLMLLIHCCLAYARNNDSIDAKQVTGTWESENNVISILALNDEKLKVELDLSYEYPLETGSGTNLGFALGQTTLKERTAIFIPPDTENCKITMQFETEKMMKVTQEGKPIECGFGLGVYANGSYKKVSSAEPKFQEDL
jgi:hypothetical protein